MRQVLLYILLFVFISSCKKGGTTNEPTVDLSNGTWRISYFWDVQDKTSGYSSYYFMFQSDGTFMAHSNTNMFLGTWSQTGTRININFSGAPMNDLNGDWLKTELTNSTSIKLKDDGASQDDKLYFVKN